MNPCRLKPSTATALGLLLMFLGLPPVKATAQASLARQVADGRPWNMAMKDGPGRTMRLTLNPDGTGRIEGGPMTMSPTWRESGADICIKPGLVMPERCATLRKEGAKIVGLKDGEVQFRLERP
jgi:hypothetical protein